MTNRSPETTPREVIARRRAGFGADEMVHHPAQKSWEAPSMRAWESHAIDVDDDLAALDAAGFVIVPKEPTQAMLDAAWVDAHAGDLAGVWRSMIWAVEETGHG